MKIGVFLQLVVSLTLTACGVGSDDNPFDAVDSAARAAFAAEGIPGMGLAITGTARGHCLLRKSAQDDQHRKSAARGWVGCVNE